ncbi:hypothetical protein C8Q78DRAFT_778168 [Trametes maxima]|nr:hypothetical protein C8Q78DRAFT_778168 [Trametes maxima]
MSEEEIGTLVVVVLKARNLKDKHTFYKQDAYTQVALNKDTKKTQVDVKGGQHPVWDEELRFPIVKRASDDTRKMEVSCWSKEPRTDDCVGRGTVDITETLKTGEFDDWVPLKMEDGSYRGDLYLEMTYYSKTPPLQRRASKWKPSERLNRPATAYAYSDVPAVPSLPSTAVHHRTGSASTTATVPSDPDELPLPSGYQQSVASGHIAAVQPVSAKAHRTPQHKHDALPPLPEEPSPAPTPIPAILRPGGGPRISPQTSPKASNDLLPQEHPVHAHAPVPHRDPSPPVQAPFESIPPYLRPGGGQTPIPEPHIPPPQTYAPPQETYARRQSYVPPQTYGSPEPYPPASQSYSPPEPYPPQTYGPPPQPFIPPSQPFNPPPQPYGSPRATTSRCRRNPTYPRNPIYPHRPRRTRHTATPLLGRPPSKIRLPLTFPIPTSRPDTRHPFPSRPAHAPPHPRIRRRDTLLRLLTPKTGVPPTPLPLRWPLRRLP